MRLVNLDLNLLIALQALLRERSVSRAATTVGVSQPAMSGALARLRRHFDDALLRRSGNSYQLTPLAAELLESTEVAVTSVHRVFSPRTDFEPGTAEREFRVLMSDYSLAVLGDAVSALVDRAAPRVRLRIEGLPTESAAGVADLLRVADALVTPHGFVSNLPFRDLYTDEWICLASAGNDAIGECPTIGQLAELPWVLTRHQPPAFPIDTKPVQVDGRKLDVRLVTESFTALPFLIAGTNRIGLLQRKLADQLHGFRLLPCPFDTQPLVEALWWHPMNDHDRGHQWLREIFAEAAAWVVDAESYAKAGWS